jgi:hypothetical protein
VAGARTGEYADVAGHWRLLNAALYAMALTCRSSGRSREHQLYNVPGNLLDPFTDANTYLAARNA